MTAQRHNLIRPLRNQPRWVLVLLAVAIAPVVVVINAFAGAGDGAAAAWQQIHEMWRIDN
jgi:hypothetical protein